jgi:hypothetical protein
MVALDLARDPPEVEATFLVPQFRGRRVEVGVRRKKSPSNLAPLAIHQVRLVVFDLPEERLARLTASSMSPDDETLHGRDLSVRTFDAAGLLDSLAVGAYRDDGGEHAVRRRDETPVFGELSDFGGGESVEGGLVDVETVQVETGQLGRVRQDMLLERVVAQLRVPRENVRTCRIAREGDRTEATHLCDRGQVTPEEFRGQVFLRPSDRLEMSFEPVLASF